MPPREITLEQLAGVNAALAEGLPLPAVLKQEGIAPETWAEGSRAWKQKLAGGGELVRTYAERLAEAEDALSRRVHPLDQDLEAWSGFLVAVSSEPDCASLLRRFGLGMNDLARLQRTWSKRLDGDAELSSRAARLAGTAAPPARVDVDPPALRPFPWTPAAASETSAAPPPDPRRDPPFDRPDDRGVHPAERALDLYAALRVALEALPGERAATLAACGLAPERYEALRRAWTARLEAQPALRARYEACCARQRTLLRWLLRD